MSRRTLHRAGIGLLAIAGLIALSSPLLAQKPNPWRGTGAAPAPVACVAGQNTVVVRFSPPAQAPASCCESAPCPTPNFVVRTTDAASKPAGTWYREMPGMVAALCFRGDELTITLHQNMDGRSGRVILTADYAVAKDGTVHGVITGADMKLSGVGRDPVEDVFSQTQKLQKLVDQPFAFRCRQSEGGMMISHWRIACPDAESKGASEDMELLAGRYEASNGPLPLPRSPNEGVSIDYGFPTARYSQAAPPYVPAALELNLSPSRTTPPCPVPSPRPALPTPPPEVHGIMIGTFNQMLSEMQAPSPCPPPVGLSTTWSTSPPCLQPGMPVEVSPWCPVPVPPIGIAVPPIRVSVPPPPPNPPMIAPSRMPVGNWVREMGPIKYAVDIKDGHLSMTVTMTDSKEQVAVHHILTADCYPTRNGSELVGLLTSFDLAVEGNGANSSQLGDQAERVVKLQKEIAEQPFAMSFRVYDGTLVIGNVRLPAMKEASEIGEVLSIIAGRYKQSHGPAANPRPVRAARTCDGPQCLPTVAPPAVLVQPVEFGTAPAVPPMPQPVPLPRQQLRPSAPRIAPPHE